MNSTLSKALVASLLSAGCVVPAFAQWDYDPNCQNPTLTTSPFSPGYVSGFRSTPMFAAGLGMAGTSTYLARCTPGEPSGASVFVPGRIGFGAGSIGSIQDDLNGVPVDNHMTYNWGFNYLDDPTLRWKPDITPSAGAWSYATLVAIDSTGKRAASTAFGSQATVTGYTGASNRYMLLTQDHTLSTGGVVEVTCRIDVLADAARVGWSLKNLSSTDYQLGLWFGQWVILRDANFAEKGYTLAKDGRQFTQPYITAPGQKPIVIGQRFNRLTDPTNFPSYLNFTGGRADGQGLQVVMGQTPNTTDENQVNDQTPVDEFVVGDFPGIMGDIKGSVSNPKFGDSFLPDVFIAPEVAYLQKWEPSTVAPGETRFIGAYYRSTWGDANYQNGYAAVVDTPKVLSTNSNGVLTPNPFTIRVAIDNTGGFGIVNQNEPMQSVRVRLNLPTGMSIVGGQTDQFISVINPTEIKEVTYQVQADQTAVGDLNYSVTITPTPGGSKTVNGVITVAATPVVRLTKGANLVAAPWVFTDPSWDSVLSPFVLNQDFQAFDWEPVSGQYVPSTAATRGTGTWIVFADTIDPGYFTLQGSPVQAPDTFPPDSNGLLGGAPSIQLKRGWNLIGNPYNYAISLGQIIGVRRGTTLTATFQELVDQGSINGSFNFYNPDSHSYDIIQGAQSKLAANNGYWLYANEDLTLTFPPVYDLFTRSIATPTAFRQNVNQYRVQVAAQTATANDAANYAGITKDYRVVNQFTSRKAPASPTPDAVRAYFVEGTRGSATELAQVMRATRGRQSYMFNVWTRKNETVAVTIPNLAQLPRNLDIRIVDLSTGRSVDGRRGKLTFASRAQTTKNLRIDITPVGGVVQRIGAVVAKTTGKANLRNVEIDYYLSIPGITNLRLLKNGIEVAKIAVDHTSVAGLNVVNWGGQLSGGPAVGTYQLEVASSGDSGEIARKIVNVSFPR